jgi:holin-like protein
MLAAFAALLVCQLAGEAAARALGLPVPGPVLGLLLLFAFVFWRGGPPEPVRDTALGLLRHLPILFVPAAVGVIRHVDRIADEWLAILVALTVGTWLTIVVTAWTLRLVLKLTGAEAEDA